MKRKLKSWWDWLRERGIVRCESCGREIHTDPERNFEEFFQRYEPKGPTKILGYRLGVEVDHRQYYCADCVEVDSL